MKSFAEELVYWYLRFNGFFPLTNFVLHRQDLISSQSADTDLLGVRPKFVSEEIGGQHIDPMLFMHFRSSINIGLICEVKSGENPGTINLSREDRLRYCLKRIGFFSENKVNMHMKSLLTQKVIHGEFHEVGKLLITEKKVNDPGFICLRLKHIEMFILERIEQYPVAKGGAKHFFESDMLQYMIWKRRHGMQ